MIGDRLKRVLHAGADMVGDTLNSGEKLTKTVVKETIGVGEDLIDHSGDFIEGAVDKTKEYGSSIYDKVKDMLPEAKEDNPTPAQQKQHTNTDVNAQ